MHKSLKLAFGALVFLISSCASDTEQKGLQEITELYGGSATITKGVSTSTSKGSNDYLEVNLKNPGILDNKDDMDRIGEIAFNSLFILYHNQTQEEREDYTLYSIEIEKDNKTFTAEAKSELLKSIEDNREEVLNTTESYSKREYTKATENYHPIVASDTSLFNKFHEHINLCLDSIGAFKESFIIGLNTQKTTIPQIDSEEQTYILYFIKHKHEKGSMYYKLTVYPNKTGANIISMNASYSISKTVSQ